MSQPTNGSGIVGGTSGLAGGNQDQEVAVSSTRKASTSRCAELPPWSLGTQSRNVWIFWEGEMYRNPHGFCMCSIVYLGFFWGIRRLISTIPPNSIDTRYHIDTNWLQWLLFSRMSSLQKKAFSNQSKGHLGSRKVIIDIPIVQFCGWPFLCSEKRVAPCFLVR